MSNPGKAGGAESPPKEENLGNISGKVVIDLATPKLGLQRAVLTGNTVIELIKAPANPIAVSILLEQDSTGGHTWSAIVNGKELRWIGGTSEPEIPTGKDTEIMLTMLCTANGAELLGLTGLPGPKGEKGNTGPEGNKPTFHAMETLGTHVENQEGEYAPAGCMVGDAKVDLCGVVKIASGGAAANAMLMQLPAAAHPLFQQLVWAPNGENVLEGVILVIHKNGEITCPIELPGGFVPALSECSFPLEH